jgi:hypothetical protein
MNDENQNTNDQMNHSQEEVEHFKRHVQIFGLFNDFEELIQRAHADFGIDGGAVDDLMMLMLLATHEEGEEECWTSLTNKFIHGYLKRELESKIDEGLKRIQKAKDPEGKTIKLER